MFAVTFGHGRKIMNDKFLFMALIPVTTHDRLQTTTVGWWGNSFARFLSPNKIAKQIKPEVTLTLDNIWASEINGHLPRVPERTKLLAELDTSATPRCKSKLNLTRHDHSSSVRLANVVPRDPRGILSGQPLCQHLFTQMELYHCFLFSRRSTLCE